MKAVVLMAGKGKRWAQHFEGPKQLMPVAGKPIIEHALDALPGQIEELVFIVGGPHEQRIRDYFKSGKYHGKPITFVVQQEQLGLAHAFRCARRVVLESARGPEPVRWLGMVGDDVYGSVGLRDLLRHDLAVLASRVEHPETFGVLVADEEGNLIRSVEKPQEFISDLVWNGAMVMDEDFFEAETQPSARGEYETPDVWMKLIEQGRKIKVVEADLWLPINDKKQYEEAERLLS
jgi:dTDP-glucose pyrophosphorylase